MLSPSVRTRLTSKDGMSYTEFSYQLLQAYDFYHLHKSASCTIQIGGSDQWGNILAGIDLINRINPTNMNTYVREQLKCESALVSTRLHQLKPRLTSDNVGDDCPVFDGLFDYCSISAGGSMGQSRVTLPLRSFHLCFLSLQRVPHG